MRTAGPPSQDVNADAAGIGERIVGPLRSGGHAEWEVIVDLSRNRLDRKYHLK